MLGRAIRNSFLFRNATSVRYLFTYLYTPWSRVLLENLTGFELVKKFPAFYGTRRFITAFTGARHLFLSSASSFESITPHSNSLISILKLSSNLRLDLPSGFPTKPLYTLLLFPIRATCPTHLIPLDLITRTILGEWYTNQRKNSTEYNFP